MPANIGDVRADATAIHGEETALGGVLYDLSFSAEYGYGSTAEAIESIRSSRRHAVRAVLAADIGNAVMAAKHEVQAVAADGDAARMLERAKGYCDDLIGRLQAAAATVDSAVGHAKSLVSRDDSSPAAEIHTKVAGQSKTLGECRQRAEEIRSRLHGSGDPAELQVAADNFVALRHELEEGSGRAQEIVSDSLEYSSSI